MNMLQNPKSEMDSSCEDLGLAEKMGTQMISVSDHVNGIHYTTEESDNFVIDMERFPHIANKESSPNARIIRSLSRKGSFRGMEKKLNSNPNPNPNPNPNDKETFVANSSPRGCGTPEKTTLVPVGTTDRSINNSSPQAHHQITITTTTGNINGGTESRFAVRKNSFKRSPPSSWLLDPKKVMLFFATLSSLGTILLIIFTLSTSKLNVDETDFH